MPATYSFACQNTSVALRFRRLPAASPAGPDNDLVRRVAAGDQLAMRLLFARHRDRTFKFLLRLIKDEALAEDVLIEAFFEVWRGAGKFEARSTFTTWLLAIARNRAISALGRHNTVELDDEIVATVPDPGEDPESMLASKDTDETLRRCLARLSSKHTEVIDLVYYHGKSVAETAEVLKISQATVKTRMFYARRRLQELVAAATGSD